MKRRLSQIFFQFLGGAVLSGIGLYAYLNEQNKCTEIKMRLPKIVKEIEAIEQINSQLNYQIVCFESPEHLIQLANLPDYAHLKFPYFQEVFTLKEGLALEWSPPTEKTISSSSSLSKPSVILGAKKPYPDSH